MDPSNEPTVDSALAERLRGALRRVARRVRQRRVAGALGLVGLGGCVLLAIGGAWCIVRGTAVLQTLGPIVWALLAVGLAAVGAALLRPVPARWVAREVDRRLGLQDRAAAALAVVEGTVRSRLSDAVATDALSALEADPRRLDAAFPGVPARRLLAAARIAAILVAAVLLAAFLSRFLPSGGLIPIGPGGEDVRETRDGAATARLPPSGDEDPEGDPDPPEQPEEVETPEAEDDPPAPPEPEPPAAPGARLAVVMSGAEFEPTDTVLALVSVWPTEALERPRGYRLLLAIDGNVIDPDESLAVSPEQARGLHLPLILNHLDGASDALQPGEHEVVALLEPEGGGDVIRSEPARYRIRGDDGGGGGGGDDDEGGGGGDTPPSPETPPPPPPLPPPPPTAADPEAGEDAPGAPPDDEPVTLPEETEIKIVVPLVGAGDEVHKEGPRLVLSPSGGTERTPERVPLEEALPEARRRAERAVDRAGVRAADRDLVRRYFERLLRLTRGEPR